MGEPVYLYDDDVYTPPKTTHAPRSLLDFIEALAPIAKYYAVLLFFWYLATRFNAAVDREADLQEKERERPKLSPELVDMSSDEEDEDESEEEKEEIYEELVTDGSRLVSVPGEHSTVRERKPQQAENAEKPKKIKSGKSHPLFEGLRQVEEELREQREKEQAEPNVSWNDLHQSMLKRYQQKFPEHGIRTADGDDYDDEFKELLKKHNVDLQELKKQK